MDYLQLAAQICSYLAEILKKDVCKQVIISEATCAYDILSSIGGEKDKVAALHRALTHLESAHKLMKTWVDERMCRISFVDDFKSLYSSRYDILNSLCYHIGVIHYVLGSSQSIIARYIINGGVVAMCEWNWTIKGYEYETLLGKEYYSKWDELYFPKSSSSDTYDDNDDYGIYRGGAFM